MNSPAISIVVLNWNGLADTLACLESLRHLHYSNYRLVVVDNGSTDGSLAALRRAVASPDAELIEAGANLGYAGGNNLGIRRALDNAADFVLVLNNDTTVDPELLNQLIASAEAHPTAGCFGPWIYYQRDRERLWFTRSEWSSEKLAFTAPGKGRCSSELDGKPMQSDYVCGAALFFRDAVARKIGLFDERFFLVYEDADWCFRARRAGFECISVPEARVWHKVGSSFATEASPLRTYFSTRNRLLFAEKNVSSAQWRKILRAALSMLGPRLPFDRAAAGSTAKAVLWSVNSYFREWSRQPRDPRLTAQRRAVLDYVMRRFGDCPLGIRVLSQTWASSASIETI